MNRAVDRRRRWKAKISLNESLGVLGRRRLITPEPEPYDIFSASLCVTSLRRLNRVSGQTSSRSILNAIFLFESLSENFFSSIFTTEATLIVSSVKINHDKGYREWSDRR